MTRQIWSRAAAVALLFTLAAGQALAVDYANIDVVDGATAHVDPPIVTIPAGQQTVAGATTEGFFVDPGSVVGEIPVRIGATANNDANNGILVVSVREILRQLPGATVTLSGSPSTVADNDPSSTNTRNVSGGLAIVTDRVGNDNAGATWPVNGPMNVNVAAAYFPFSQGYKGGTVSASNIVTELDTFVGSPDITFSPVIGAGNTAHVRPNYYFDTPYDPGDSFKNGNHFVSIPGVTDSRQQGILLAMHAKNEDNMATVSALTDGEGWHLNTRDNQQDNPGEGESKPFSFVFVPLGTPNVTMAAVWGAAGPNNDPRPVLQSGSNFQIAKTSDGLNGRYRLTIDGESPTSGVLIVQSGSNVNPPGNGGLPADNVVTYMPDGDGWIITSDDMQNTNQDGNNQNGQSDERNPYFQFVFLPFDSPPGTPTIQAPAWDKTSNFNFNTAVTHLNNENNQNNGADMYFDVTGGTTGLSFVASRMNKGDNATHVNGALPTGNDGVMLTSVSEGFRDNSAGGGAASYGVATPSLTGGAGFTQWEIHTHTTSLPAEEHNINFAVAFFGRDSGFTMAKEVPTNATGDLDLQISGVNSESDGVLMINSNGNSPRFATAIPKAQGEGWTVDVKNVDLSDPFTNPPAPEVPQPNGEVTYVFLPYETENLVAGRIGADGSVVNSTGVGAGAGQFTLNKTGTGQYLLTVAGRTPNDGTLLLTPEAGFDGINDNALSYEASGNSFLITGLDLTTQAEKDLGFSVSFEDTAFAFAFIDYDAPLVAPDSGVFLEADFNQDGDVDAADLAAWKGGFGNGTTKAQGDADGDLDVDGRDFLTWQRQLGQSPAANVAAGAVPEPHSAMLALLAAAASLAVVRQRS